MKSGNPWMSVSCSGAHGDTMAKIESVLLMDRDSSLLGEGQTAALGDLCKKVGVELRVCVDAAEIVQRPASQLAVFDIDTLTHLVAEHRYTATPWDVLLHRGRMPQGGGDTMPVCASVSYLLGAHPDLNLLSSITFIMSFLNGKSFDDVPFSLALAEEGTQLQKQEFELKDSSQRKVVIYSALRFITQTLSAGRCGNIIARSGTFEEHVATVLEELLMNAVWDASSSRKNIDRRLPVELPSDESIFVEVWCNGVSVVLSVVDMHGTLELKGLGNVKQFALGARRVRLLQETTGGAGIGLYMAAQRAQAIAFEVESGVRLRASALFEPMRFPIRQRERATSVLFMDYDLRG